MAKITYHVYKHHKRDIKQYEKRVKAYNEGTPEYKKKVEERMARAQERRALKDAKRKNQCNVTIGTEDGAEGSNNGTSEV